MPVVISPNNLLVVWPQRASSSAPRRTHNRGHALLTAALPYPRRSVAIRWRGREETPLQRTVSRAPLRTSA